MFKKEKVFVTLKVWLYEKQLGSYGGMSHSPRCCVNVKTLLFSFCVYVIKGDKALTEICSFEAKWDKQKSI